MVLVNKYIENHTKQENAITVEQLLLEMHNKPKYVGNIFVKLLLNNIKIEN